MPKWLGDAVFYEIYPQSFNDTNGDGIGDINGITEKLDYIKSLGCNAIWINPCYDSPFMDAGYDVRNYKKVASRYGTNNDLIRCFSEAHTRGMHIILDLVPGHTSDTHPWFRMSRKARKNQYTDRYIWTDSVWNRPADFGCMCGVTERDGCYILNFFSSQPALNYGFNKITAPWQMTYTDPECRKTFDAMLDVMRFWLDRGCDGFRVDMADSLVKNDDDKEATCELWRRARTMLDKDYPEAAMVSEWSYPQRSLSKAKYHMDFYLDHETNGYHALFRKTDKSGKDLSFFSKKGNGNIMDFLDDYLKKYNETKSDGYISFITCNHDTPRMTLGYSALECRIAYTFIMTMPGVPFLYYGDEIGMRYIPGLTSREGGYARTGTRTPMQWSHGMNMGFSAAPSKRLYLPVDTEDYAPNVADQENDPDSILDSIRKVLKLRHSEKSLQSDGDFEVLYAKKDCYPFIYRRGGLLLAVNPSAADAPDIKGIKMPGKKDPLNGKPLFMIGECSLNEDIMRMKGQSFGIFRI